MIIESLWTAVDEGFSVEGVLPEENSLIDYRSDDYLGGTDQGLRHDVRQVKTVRKRRRNGRRKGAVLRVGQVENRRGSEFRKSSRKDRIAREWTLH